MTQSDEGKAPEDIAINEHRAKQKTVWWRRRRIWIALVFVLLAASVFRTEMKFFLHIPIATKTIMLPGDVPLELVWIPGVSLKASEGKGDSKTVAKGFWMGKTECTQEQWMAVMKTLHSAESNGQRRITQVSWNETQAFIRRLNGLTGKVFGLPTTAEWQYACRAGIETPHIFLSKWESPSYTGCVVYHGDDSLNAPFSTANGIGGANGWGLHCMKDNIDEWCQDGCYDAKDFYAPRFIDPIETKEIPFRAIRNYGTTNEVHSTGFRLVLPES